MDTHSPPARAPRFEPVDRTIAAALLALAILALLLTGTGESTFRLLAVLCFVVSAPGWAVIGYLGLPGLLTRCVAAVAVSLSIGTLTAVAMLSVGQWHPLPAMMVLESATAVALAGQLARAGLLRHQGGVEH